MLLPDEHGTAAGTSARPPLPHTAVVIPCYNAGPRLRPVVEKALRYTPHVLVVDDGSTDGAIETLRDLEVRLISLRPNQGKGFALIAGFRAALELPGVEQICVIDADGQHDPSELPNLVKAFETQQADLAIGTRAFDLPQVPWRSRFGNKLTAALTSRLLGAPVADTQSGYRLHSRRLAEAIVRDLRGGRYETEMEILIKAVRQGFVIAGVPIATVYEPGNPSSHFHKLRDSWRIYSRLLRAATQAKRGFTLIEVMFAGGILLLALGLVFGSLISLALSSEAVEQRQYAEVRVSSAMEYLRSVPPEKRLGFDPAVFSANEKNKTLSAVCFDASGSPIPLPVTDESVRTALPNPVEIQVTATGVTARGFLVPARASALLGR